MKQSVERELKLRISRGFPFPELPGARLPPRTFTSTYYDTPDYALARARVTLRRRVEGRRGAWQVKLPQGLARQELEALGPSSSPPQEFRRVLFALLRGHDPTPIAKLRTRRVGFRVRDIHGPVADVTLDSVAVLDGQRVTSRFSELEIELSGGDEQALHQIEAALRAAGAEDGDPRPKVFQALGLDLPQQQVDIAASAPAAEHLSAKLQAQVNAILAHDPGTRLGSDPEHLHQMRVATRRLRAFLRAARPMLEPEWTNSLRGELDWLGTMLGPVRDLDVLLERLQREAAHLEASEQRAFERVLGCLRAERDSARGAMLEALEGDRYLKLLDQLKASAKAPEVTSPYMALGGFAAEEFKKLRKAMRRFTPGASDAAIHRIRIRIKRARYATELAEASLGKSASRFIRCAKLLQDLLGAHQDARVAEDRLRNLVAHTRGAKTAFAVGRIVERLGEQRRAFRASLPKVWKKLERRGQKTWAHFPHPDPAPTAASLASAGGQDESPPVPD